MNLSAISYKKNEKIIDFNQFLNVLTENIDHIDDIDNIEHLFQSSTSELNNCKLFKSKAKASIHFCSNSI